MPLITVFRGFKVSVSILDAFLTANNLDETFGFPPHKDDSEAISTLLRSKMGAGAGDACVIIPQREAFSRSTLAYVAFCWLHVFVQREIKPEDDLPEIVPSGFLRLKDEILSYASDGGAGLQTSDTSCTGAIGLHIVYTGNRGWTPDVLYERIRVTLRYTLISSCNELSDTEYSPLCAAISAILSSRHSMRGKLTGVTHTDL
jgi:hypothetical protein